jgi:hypothetical protein
MGKTTAKMTVAKKKTIVSKKLLTTGTVSKTLIKRATTMSKEQWQKLQVGMDKKWPLPDHMNGTKGHMAFKDETFAQVTCWTAETRISYRPHAKAPGSKSHIRYERYSKAKTLGEAFQLGTYPADWCWDYERGFLKVVGGFVREEPLDSNEMQEGRTKDGKKITEVDKAIHTWYKRELAKKLGLSVTELSENIGSGESLGMRGQRLLAQKEAKERLEAADKAGRIISDEDVVLTLKRWSFARNPFRTNVMKKGQQWVYSDTVGLLKDRSGDIHLTASTRRYPQVIELLARWLTDRLPQDAKGFKFTSMNLNYNYAAQLHRDQNNFGPSFIKAFGEFTGGELNYYPDDPGESRKQLEMVKKTKREQFDLDKSLVLFNGNCAHSVEDFAGSRFSIVYFTMGCYKKITPEDKAKLERMGVPYPSANENPFALLRAPRGTQALSKADVIAQKKSARLPPARFWDVKKLKPRSVKRNAGALAKRRLAPENARSFYGWECVNGKWKRK